MARIQPQRLAASPVAFAAGSRYAAARPASPGRGANPKASQPAPGRAAAEARAAAAGRPFTTQASVRSVPCKNRVEHAGDREGSAEDLPRDVRVSDERP